MTKIKLLILALVTALPFLVLPIAPARADLTITPIRIVFEGRDRSATVELLNVTNKTNTYRMGWMQMKMHKEGRYVLEPVDKDDKDPTNVANMVIFTPRQVTIPAHGHQTIRLSLRRPADLPDGEYRAHLVMTKLSAQGPEKPDPNQKDVSMALRVNLSFSIPVIVRAGEDKDLKISLSNPKLGMGGTGAKPSPQLSVDVNRDAGKFSSYGTIKVYWKPQQGSEKEIGAMNNVALYPELKTRTMVLDLTENPVGGSLRVVYTGKYESDGKKWAEKTFPIGN